MALQPFFSLTPLSSYAHTYDAANPAAPYTLAYLNSFGGATGPGWRDLAYQYNNDEIIVGYDPVDLTDQTIGIVVNDVYRRCSILIRFVGNNVSTENQYLLLFALHGLEASAAQFFVGADWVRTEPLSRDEQVAILLDCPGSGVYTHVCVRLASAYHYAAMGFKGMDCYLL